MRGFGGLVGHHAAVTEHAHFGYVETFDFDFLADAVADEDLDDLIDDDGKNATA